MSWRQLSIQLLSGTSMYRELHPTKRQIASQVDKCPPAAFWSPRGRIELNPPDIASRPLSRVTGNLKAIHMPDERGYRTSADRRIHQEVIRLTRQVDIDRTTQMYS